MSRRVSFKLRVDLGKRVPRRIVYLFHLDPPPEGFAPDWHARHYLGSSEDLARRDMQHGNGSGANILRVHKERGGSWHVVRTWKGGKQKERALKTCSGTQYCRECTPEPRSGNQRGGQYRTRKQRQEASLIREANGRKPKLEIVGAREVTPAEMFGPGIPEPTPEQEQVREAACTLLEMQWKAEEMTVQEQDVRAAAREDAERVITRQLENGWGIDRMINHHDIVTSELQEAVAPAGKAYAEEYGRAAVDLLGDLEPTPEAQPMDLIPPARLGAERAPVAVLQRDGTPDPARPGWATKHGIYQRVRQADDQPQRQPA